MEPATRAPRPAPHTKPAQITGRRKGSLDKAASGLEGLDEITLGGLPRGRPTLVYGGPGCGKTLFGIQFLARGAAQHHEPGVFLAFEESIDDVKQNAQALGYDFRALIDQKLLALEHAVIDPAREIGHGEYDLDALFMRLARAVDSLSAKRLVLDSPEVLIRQDADKAAIKESSERLFRWLRNRGVTSIVTAAEGNGGSRHGFEEYIADCVVRLDHRLDQQVSTRTLRVIKYRGSAHGTNEYPFLIDQSGIRVLPVTSIGLNHQVSTERVSTGVSRLDTMLGGAGFFRGTTVMLSGTPGSGKSSLAAHYTDAACRRGERVLAFTYEESPRQITRNMKSIGLDLERWESQGLLRFIAARPSMYGLEMHLAIMLGAIAEFDPQSVIIDPISNLVRAGREREAQTMVVRLIDALKTRGITTILTHPTSGLPSADHTDLAISSIIDTWMFVQNLQNGGERNRALYILKSRGMAHSSQIREFVITGEGIELIDVYTGPDGVLTGTARASREAQDKAATRGRQQEIEREKRRIGRRRKAVEAQIAALEAELEAEELDSSRLIEHAEAREGQLSQDREEIARRRSADTRRDTPE
jgi:circadian clock protein KaiC